MVIFYNPLMRIKIFSHHIQKLIDIFLPPLCPSCKNFTASTEAVCSACAQKIFHIDQNRCKICSMPFELAIGDDMECGECLKTPPFFDKIYTPFLYEGTIVTLILQFKHHDALFLAPILSHFLQNYAKDQNINADIIMPVPLHTKKFLKRKYNQSHILAQPLAKILNIPTHNDLLKRVKDGSQKGKNKSERQKNVRHMFSLTDSEKIKGKHILLVDDVVTTGATVNEIARLLKKHGAIQVNVISLARVSYNRHNHIDF